MEYRTLGRTGLKVSAIAMGTFSFGGVGAFSRVANQGVAEARRLVDCCIDGGVNLFDTANMLSWFVRAVLIVAFLPVGLGAARTLTDPRWRHTS